MNAPQPGDVVTIVTRSRDHYYLRTSDWKETTYENVRVVKPFAWLSIHEFCIPADGPETEFASIEQVEKFDRAPAFDSRAMRYETDYTPSNSGERFTTRVIHMKNVVSVNGLTVDEYDDTIETVEIPASKGGSYTVRLEGGIGVSCTCKGFQFRNKCRHLNEAEKL